MTTFAISDTHFSHKRSLEFMRKDGSGLRLRHPFTDLEEMDEAMIERWNKTVGYNDTVLHCGDFTFGGKQNIAKHARRLNGKIILIMGNHDYSARDYVDHFHDVTAWKEKVVGGITLVFTHAPLYRGGFNYRFDGKSANVHGHLHDVKTGEPYHVNVCVENVDYTPIALEEIVKGLKKTISDRE